MQVLVLSDALNFLFPLFWLAIILAHWFKTKKVSVKLIKYGIFIAIILYILNGFYVTVATYDAWKADPVSRYLLPPHEKTYFYQYAYFHFWRFGIINLFIGAAWAAFLVILNKYSNGRFFEKSDIYLAFFTAYVVGWPKIFAYLAVTFGLMILKGVISAMRKDEKKFRITASIAFSAMLVIGFGRLVMEIPFFDNFKL